MYDYDYQKQLLVLEAIKPALNREFEGLSINDTIHKAASELDFYGKEFLIERPILKAINGKGRKVLLIDECDKAPEEIEYMLYEFLENYSISIPQYGTIRCPEDQKPIVFITSNNYLDPFFTDFTKEIGIDDFEIGFEELKERIAELDISTKIREVKEEVKDSDLYGDAVVLAVLKLVAANRTIMPSTVSIALRGLSLPPTRPTPTYINEYGKFHFVSTSDIDNVTKKLTDRHFFASEQRTGTYADYTVLSAKMSIRYRMFLDQKCENYGKNKKYSKYTDLDWIAYLNNVQLSDMKKLTDWVHLIDAASHPAAIDLAIDKVQNLLKDAPTAFVKYLNAMDKVTKGQEANKPVHILQKINKDLKKK